MSASPTNSSAKGSEVVKRPLPNILIILVDDLGKEGLSFYGNPMHKTPNLDALAEKGRVFTRCFSSPLCSMSRAMLMTGLYQFDSRIGWIPERGVQVKDTAPTVFKTLSRAGYSVFGAGKWHVGWFDLDLNHASALGVSRHLFWFMEDRATWARTRWDSPMVVENGKAEKRTGFTTEIYGRWLVDEIQSSPRPFLAYYAPNLVHAPLLDFKRNGTGGWHNFTENVTFLDSIIGRVLNYVPENTLIVFTADNGSETRVGGGKGTLSDLGCNVPLVVVGDGVVPGLDHSLIDLTDFHPTLADIAGLNLEESLHGHSFAPQLFGIAGEPRTHVTIYMRNKKEGITWAVRDHRYKLYHDGRFFDLSIDHLEEHPVPMEMIQKHYKAEYKGLLEKTPG
jgi:arylsulfatase A